MTRPKWHGWALGAALGTAAVLTLGLLARAQAPAADEHSSAPPPAAASAVAPATGSAEPATGSAEPAPKTAGPSTNQAAQSAGGRLAELTPKAGMRGWELFFSKGCIKCHAVWGQGGTIGPDLGRAHIGHLSEGELAAQMWNSIPRMWAQIEAEQIHYQSMSRDDMRHLFAFFFFLRYMDQPGDARLGGLAMLRYRCQACHQIAGRGGALGPDLARWAQYTNPIAWSLMMWRAAPEMRKRMAGKGMKWPEFSPGDLTNMMAYVRSVSPSHEKVALGLPSPANGAELLRTKKCTSCHQEQGGKAPDLREADLPADPADVAAAMLSHAPEMLDEMSTAGLEPVKLEPPEMADIVAYLLAAGYLDQPADAVKGAKLFRDKGCTDCHETGTSAAPELAKMHPQGTASYLAYVMWNKGPEMYRELTKAGSAWPQLSRSELLDLLAFFRQQH